MSLQSIVELRAAIVATRQRMEQRIAGLVPGAASPDELDEARIRTCLAEIDLAEARIRAAQGDGSCQRPSA